VVSEGTRRSPLAGKKLSLATCNQAGHRTEKSREVKRSELLCALQLEIQQHSLSTFMKPEHKIVEPGCPACQKHLGTVEQFKRHITEDVLPPLLDKLSVEGK
jgi:hypothetical protein